MFVQSFFFNHNLLNEKNAGFIFTRNIFILAVIILKNQVEKMKQF